MIDKFAAQLRKDLEESRERVVTYLVSGGAPDFTGYKALCAKVEEIDRQIVRIKDLEVKYLKREGLIDD